MAGVFEAGVFETGVFEAGLFEAGKVEVVVNVIGVDVGSMTVGGDGPISGTGRCWVTLRLENMHAVSTLELRLLYTADSKKKLDQ